MSFSIEYTPASVKQIKKIPRDILPKIIELIENLSENPYPEGHVKIKGHPELFHSDYRIIYTVKAHTLTVVIVRIGERNEIYKKLFRLKY
jgi:mRNA interferase RelE/StbE